MEHSIEWWEFNAFSWHGSLQNITFEHVGQARGTAHLEIFSLNLLIVLNLNPWMLFKA